MDRVKLDPYRLVGTTLGTYEILELIGIGGMGVVYRAKHKFFADQDFVALKILKPDLALESPRTKKKLDELFLEEARNTFRLNHQHIVRVMHADTSNDIAYLVMEWLDGHTLEEEIVEQRGIQSERVAILLEQICEGIAHAHNKGIVHRDLKPSNILLVKDASGEEMVKILDFGIAKALNSTNSRVIGAPHYASPEQFQIGAPIDQRSDVYSLGVVIYEMLSGKLPFIADSVGQLVRLHLTEPPTSLREIRPEISEALEDVVLRALALNPADRYQSVMELARAIRVAANQETGTLILQCLDASTGSNIPGASVYVNSKYAGKTNEEGRWQRDGLPPRQYRLDIDCLGYLAVQQRVGIETREHKVVEFALTARESGDLSVRTIEGGSGALLAGADVLLNGKILGSTGQIGLLHKGELTPGKFELQVSHPKRLFTFTTQVEIVHGLETHLDVEFPPEKTTPWTITLRWVVFSLLIASSLIAVIVLYRFSQSSDQREQLLDTMIQASQHNDAAALSFATAQSLAALPYYERTAFEPSIKLGYESAALEFRKAANLQPQRDDYYYSLGLSLLYSGQFEEAQKALRSASDLNAENTEYWFAGEALRTMLRKWQERESAGATYQHATALNPALYYFERGNALLKESQDQCAEFEYRAAIQIDPENAEFYYMQAESLFRQRRYKSAQPLYQTACSFDRSEPTYRQRLEVLSAPGVIQDSDEEKKKFCFEPCSLDRSTDSEASKKLCSDGGCQCRTKPLVSP